MSAPTPISFSPPVTTIALCAPPVFSKKDPADPELAVPVENAKEPLIPATPALSVLILTEPEVDCVPASATKEINPPVRLSPLPAKIFMEPPIPAVPLLATPAVIETDPPR